MLAQVPDGTDVVVLDEDGEVVPLATQEAATAIAAERPDLVPGQWILIALTGGCSDRYDNLTELLDNLTGANQPTQNGTIWIEKTYNSSTAEPGGTTNITIDGDNYNTWRNNSLTIQGGWNGPGTNTIDASTPSLFSGDRFVIVHWRGDITIRNILINGGSDAPRP